MSEVKVHNVGIIMNGVTGRMGTNQHLLRSICAIIKQGGVKLSETEFIMPDPILVGRNTIKLQQLVKRTGLTLRWTTNLDEAMADKNNIIYFDAQTTDRRATAVKQAIKAGKHIYCEKPTAVSVEAAYELYTLAQKAGVKNGVVQDKLWLPGLMKLKELIHRGFFGKILSVRGEFGYWVFEGDTIPLQRPSWNYRKEDGGGMIIDMLCHWRYVLDDVFGKVQAVSCRGATHVETRYDEAGKPYTCTADDSAYDSTRNSSCYCTIRSSAKSYPCTNQCSSTSSSQNAASSTYYFSFSFHFYSFVYFILKTELPISSRLPGL